MGGREGRNMGREKRMERREGTVAGVEIPPPPPPCLTLSSGKRIFPEKEVNTHSSMPGIAIYQNVLKTILKQI